MFSLYKDDINSVDLNKLEKELSDIKLIDIRENFETSMGSVSYAKKVPMNTLLENPEKYLNKNDEYYIMCQSGMRSMNASKQLHTLGYKVNNVSGGFSAYRGKNIK